MNWQLLTKNSPNANARAHEKIVGIISVSILSSALFRFFYFIGLSDKVLYVTRNENDFKEKFQWLADYLWFLNMLTHRFSSIAWLMNVFSSLYVFPLSSLCIERLICPSPTNFLNTMHLFIKKIGEMNVRMHKNLYILIVLYYCLVETWTF